MTTEHRPIQVLVVSPDVALLHEIAWMLDTVGYDVQTSNDLEQTALWRRYALPEVLIIDGREIAKPTGDVFRHESDRPYSRIFLYNTDKATDFGAWYAAGAHDGLRTPVSRGELLSRIRTAARYVEFERRLQQRSSFSQLAGMYTRRGLGRRLQRITAGDEFGLAQHAVLAVAIDWYAGIRRKSGDIVAQKLLTKAARVIRRVTGENAISAYLDDGVFAALLVGQSIPAAKSIAESLVKEFGSRESLPESIPGPTLTCAVTTWAAGAKADRLLYDALETLKLASHSGGDRILENGDYSKELAAWQQEMAIGNPFANVAAQDIMEPFPAILNQDGKQNGLFEALRRAGVPLRVYVDSDGRLAGAATGPAELPDVFHADLESSTREEIAMPQTIANDASFSEIYETFMSHGCAELVVTAGNRPVGYITCDGFLSMIDPVHLASFAHTESSPEELAFLLVPSMICEPAADPVIAK